MAHAYGGEGLTDAVKAGVRSIEHELHLAEEQAASLTAGGGYWLVPTLAVMYELAVGAREGQFGESTTSRVQEIEPIIGDAVAVACEAGVRIAVGTDLIAQRTNFREMAFLKDAGLPAAEVFYQGRVKGPIYAGSAIAWVGSSRVTDLTRS